MSDDVIRARWARFVARALESARARGLTDREIERLTGVRASTFHRWKRGELRTLPDIARVRGFCGGLGLSLDDALAALGMTAQRDNPAPEPVLPPEIRTLMRKLADPNVPETEKIFIRESLRMLADRGGRQRRESAG